MGFKLFVEIGRVVFINFGENYGKAGVILDIVDKNRVLVEGPGELGLTRQVFNLKQIKLTNLKLKMQRCPRPGNLLKICTEFGLVEKVSNTKFAQRMAKQTKRANTTDFDRFKVMVCRKRRSYATRVEFAKRGGKALKKYVQ